MGINHLPSFLFEDFLDESQKMSKELPHLSEDIFCRVELLTAKWELLQMKAVTERRHKKEEASTQIEGKAWGINFNWH